MMGALWYILYPLLFMEKTFALDMRPQEAQGCHRSEIQE